MSIFVIGKNGLLGQSLKIHRGWNFLSHDEALSSPAWVTQASCVINCAFAPALRTNPYNEADDIDLTLARMIAAEKSHYIMISSRAAYGVRENADRGWQESDTPRPHNDYARNKLHIEKSLTSILGDRLTVLRLATMFGHELNRPSFMGMALGGLREKNTITLDMHPDVPRDFYAVWRSEAMNHIATAPKPGLYNLGSGHGTKCGDIARWLIAGYGQGHFTHTADHKDPFFLNMDKTHAAWPGIAVTTPQQIREDVMSCGMWLRDRNRHKDKGGTRPL
jgi:UDP-glucose 4-epimerase